MDKSTQARSAQPAALESLTISNYRSCLNTKISLQPDLSVLIGPNGSGKTNILSAALLLRSLANERDPSSGVPNQTARNQCTLKACFRGLDAESVQFGSQKAILTADIQLDTDRNNKDVIVGSRQYWYARDYTRSAKRIHLPMWLARQIAATNIDLYPWIRRSSNGVIDELPEGFRAPLNSIIHFLSDIKYYSASQFTNPSTSPVSFEVEKIGQRGRGVGLRGHTRFLYDLYISKNTPSYEQFFSVIGPDGIGLLDKIEFNEIPTSSINYTVKSGGEVQQHQREKIMVVPRFVIDGNALSPSQLSEGTFKTMTLLFYVMTERSSALFIEEPEVCVHHGLLSSIIALIKTYSRNKQIVVSTHSDFVLDHIEPKHVYRVTKGEFGTSVAQITKSMSSKELSALKHYLESEGNLGEYWRHGGLD